MIAGEIEIVPAGANSMEAWKEEHGRGDGVGAVRRRRDAHSASAISHADPRPHYAPAILSRRRAERMIIDPRHRMTRMDPASFLRGRKRGRAREMRRCFDGDEVSRPCRGNAARTRLASGLSPGSPLHFVCSFVIDESRGAGAGGRGGEGYSRGRRRLCRDAHDVVCTGASGA
jgi:hypothetical protein